MSQLEIPDPDPFENGTVYSPIDGDVTVKILIDTLQRLVKEGKIFYNTVVSVKGKDWIVKGSPRGHFGRLGTMVRNDKGNLLMLVAQDDDPNLNGTEIPFE